MPNCQCGMWWADWAYSSCPGCVDQAEVDAALALFRSEIETEAKRQQNEYAPSEPIALTSWWARSRHVERVHSAGNSAVGRLERFVFQRRWVWQQALPEPTRLWDRWYRSCGAMLDELAPLYSQIRATAELAVPWIDEREPAPGAGRLGLAKGTCSVTVPAGAIARRGGGEQSFVIFYDRGGEILAAWSATGCRNETWVVPMSLAAAQAVSSPLLPALRTGAEQIRRSLFGGA